MEADNDNQCFCRGHSISHHTGEQECFALTPLGMVSTIEQSAHTSSGRAKGPSRCPRRLRNLLFNHVCRKTHAVPSVAVASGWGREG